MRWWTLYTEERLISVVLKRRGGRVKMRGCLVQHDIINTGHSTSLILLLKSVCFIKN